MGKGHGKGRGKGHPGDGSLAPEIPERPSFGGQGGCRAVWSHSGSSRKKCAAILEELIQYPLSPLAGGFLFLSKGELSLVKVITTTCGGNVSGKVYWGGPQDRTDFVLPEITSDPWIYSRC